MCIRIQHGSIAPLILAIGAYSLLVIQHVLFGAVAAAGLLVSYTVWQRGETADAAVLFALWAAVAGATWTARLELIVAAIVVSALFYFGWHTARGHGRPPT